MRYVCLLATILTPAASAQPPLPSRPPLVRVVDLEVGESQHVVLSNKKKITVKVVDLKERRDEMRNAVREAQVKVEVDGRPITLTSATYRLPATIGDVQIDCPITKGYLANTTADVWGLVKSVRLRLWPAGSPLQRPRTFVYPLKQRWFASMTQMANEPVYVDGGENPLNRKIYYHWGLDMGGAEGMADVVAATDGLVVSAGKAILPGFQDTPARPRYDVIYLLDDQGWYYRYSHLLTIDAVVKPGAKVQMGQKLGVLGKEGGSGGWSHLHFDITSKQPSGKWGIQEGYAFLWEAYHEQYKPSVLAVARPHHFAAVGQKVKLDATRSWAADKIAKYEWTFTDGNKATGTTIERSYSKIGCYSEILKVTDTRGRIDYDFAVVQVVDPSDPRRLAPTIHAAYAPTFDINPKDEITFKVRTFRTTEGHETWDFGDGTEKVKTKSDGNVKPLDPNGYAITRHRYAKAGHYVVRVERSTDDGRTAIAHLQVRIGVD